MFQLSIKGMLNLLSLKKLNNLNECIRTWNGGNGFFTTEVRYREDCRSTTSETAFGWSSRQSFPRDHSGRLKYTLWSLGSPFGPHSFMTTRMQPPHPHPTPVSDWIESKSSPCSSLSSISSLVIWKHLQIITFLKETPLIRWPNQSMNQSGTF